MENSNNETHIASATIDFEQSVNVLEFAKKLDLGKPASTMRWVELSNGKYKVSTQNISEEAMVSLKEALNPTWTLERKEKVVVQGSMLAKRIKDKYDVKAVKVIKKGGTMTGFIFYYLKDKIVEKGLEIINSLKSRDILANPDKTCVCYRGLQNQ